VKWFLFVFVMGMILTCVAFEEYAWDILGLPYFREISLLDLAKSPESKPALALAKMTSTHQLNPGQIYSWKYP
jgi:hypothetical protein